MESNKSYQIYLKWKNIDSLNLKRFGVERLALMKRQVKEYGKQKAVENRIPELKREARRRPLPTTKLIIAIITAIAGAMIFGSAMRVFASNLGSFALPAALLGGGLMGYAIDELATRASTNYACRQYTLCTFKNLSMARKRELSQGGNDIVRAYFEAQIEVIQRIEGNALEKTFPVNFILAGLLSLAEYSTAFWLISQLGLFDTIPIIVQLIIAGLPVILTWVISRIKAQKFGIPEYAADLLSQYYKSGLINIDDSLEESQRLAEEQYLTDARLDAGIRSILDESSNPKYSTPRLAELDFIVEYQQSKVQDIKDRCLKELEGIEKRFDEQIRNLPDRFSAPEIEEKERTHQDIRSQEKKIENLKREWVQEETQKIQEKLDLESKRLKAKYQIVEQEYQQKVEKAQSEYDQAYYEEFGESGIA